ncbi:MAG: class I SAM-dependent methyltransferase [Thermoanaerobaculia bacterium]
MFGENVTPAVPNDLFRAHESIYQFCARYVAGKRVLDIGCGTGYGAHVLLAGDARTVTAVDAHQGNVRYAQKRATVGLHYQVGNAEELPADLGTFDVIVSSNVFEHLGDVESALAQVLLHLAGDGLFLLAVPPMMPACRTTCGTRITCPTSTCTSGTSAYRSVSITFRCSPICHHLTRNSISAARSHRPSTRAALRSRNGRWPTLPDPMC